MPRTALFLLGILAFAPLTHAADAFRWPNGTRAAVSLAYDDAVASQLDQALPVLDRHGLKGSFYLTLSSETVVKRLHEWRAAAANGHELANHSLFHQCSRSAPGREWVTAENDLDHITVDQLAAQIRLGNAFLHAIDGRSARTLTVPCGDLKAGGKPYLPAVQAEFVAIKAGNGTVIADMSALDPYAVPVVAPSGNLSGQALIAIAKEAATRGTMANFTFHGVGGDHLAVTSQAHAELVAYLAANRDVYWTNTFIAIMTYVKEQQERLRTQR